MAPKRAKELGAFVKRLRTVTQPELAAAGGFSKEWLSRLENGNHTSISVLELARLSEALGFDRGALADYAAGGKQPSVPASNGHRADTPADLDVEAELEWIRRWASLMERRVEDLEFRVRVDESARRSTGRSAR